MNKKNKNESLYEKTNSPYLEHIGQDHWNEVNAKHIEDSNVWKRMAIIAIISLFIVCLYSLFLINQDKHKTIVFEKDNSGNLQALGIASSTLQVDNRIIAHQLINFITALREAPTDINIKRRNIDLVHKMTDPKIKAQIDQILINQYTKAKNGAAIYIQVTNVKPLAGGKSWSIRWVEDFKGTTNSVVVTNWDATVTFKRLTTSDLATQMINPAGLFIDQINITQDINDKGT